MNQQPQHIESELYALGVAMLFPREADDFDTLPADAYFDTRNSIIAQAIIDMRAKGLPVDIVLLKQELGKRNQLDMAGGIVQLTQCTSKAASSTHLKRHIDLIRQAWYGRQILQRSATATNAILSGQDIPEQIEEFETMFTNMWQGFNRGEGRSMDQVASDFLEQIDTINASAGGIIGTRSGIIEVDNNTKGWQPTNLIIIGARPGMGKSDLALGFSRVASMNGAPTGFISLEMNEMECMTRLVAMHAEIDKHQVIGNDPRLRKKVIGATSDIAKSGLRIVDAGSADLAQIKALCRKLVHEGCKMIVIDYLQLISTPGKQRKDLEVADITRSLKMDIAKDLNIPVILLSQLSRAVESRGGDKRPILSDLRESGAIEQDANVVMFLYRPEYYGFETDDEGNSTIGMAELIIAKNRGGAKGAIKTSYIPSMGIFESWGYHSGIPAINGSQYADVEF